MSKDSVAFEDTISLHQAREHLRRTLAANDFEIERWIKDGRIQAYRHHRTRDDDSCSKAEHWRYAPDRGGPEIDAGGEPRIYPWRRFLREDIGRFDPSVPGGDEREPMGYSCFGIAGLEEVDGPHAHGFNPSGRFVSYRQVVAFIGAFADTDEVASQLRFEISERSISAYGLATDEPSLEDSYFPEAQILGWATMCYGRPFDGWNAISASRLSAVSNVAVSASSQSRDPRNLDLVFGGRSMNVIVNILDHGKPREAIPVRAIPWATDFHVSPDVLADDLSMPFSRVPRDSGLMPRLKDTTARSLIGDGKARAIRPKEWDAVVKTLRSIHEDLGEMGLSRVENRRQWEIRATGALPAGAFLWLDEFDLAFRRGWESWPHPMIAGESGEYIYVGREGDREYTCYPIIPKCLESIVLDGFDVTLQPGDQTEQAPDRLNAELASRPLGIQSTAGKAKPEVQNDEGVANPKGRDPRTLELVVDVRGEQVTVIDEGGTSRAYSRRDITGKGKITWLLLALFASRFGSVEGKSPETKKLNYSRNRQNLGKALAKALELRESPFIKGDANSTKFRSIYAENDGIDAMERQTKSLDEMGTDFLAGRGEDMPPIR